MGVLFVGRAAPAWEASPDPALQSSPPFREKQKPFREKPFREKPFRQRQHPQNDRSFKPLNMDAWLSDLLLGTSSPTSTTRNATNTRHSVPVRRSTTNPLTREGKVCARVCIIDLDGAGTTSRTKGPAMTLPARPGTCASQVTEDSTWPQIHRSETASLLVRNETLHSRKFPHLEVPDRHEHLCPPQVGYREICSAVREDEGYKKAGREPSTSTSRFRPPNINRIYHALCPPALPALHKKGSKVSMNEKKKKNNNNPEPLPPPLPSAIVYAAQLGSMPVKLPPPPQGPGSISILTPPTHPPPHHTTAPSSLFYRRHHLPTRNLYPPTTATTPTDLTPAGPIPCRKEISKKKRFVIIPSPAARSPFCAAAAAVVHVYHPAATADRPRSIPPSPAQRNSSK